MGSGNFGGWTLVAVQQYLEENEYVDYNLECTTHPELDGSLTRYEVRRLKSVSTEPHQDHLNTAHGYNGKNNNNNKKKRKNTIT